MAKFRGEGRWKGRVGAGVGPGPSRPSRTPEELKRLIEQETKLIAELEAQKSPAPDTSEWYQHQTKIRDAYWRRRNWIAYLDDPDFDPLTNPG